MDARIVADKPPGFNKGFPDFCRKIDIAGMILFIFYDRESMICLKKRTKKEKYLATNMQVVGCGCQE